MRLQHELFRKMHTLWMKNVQQKCVMLFEWFIQFNRFDDRNGSMLVEMIVWFLLIFFVHCRTEEKRNNSIDPTTGYLNK